MVTLAYTEWEAGYKRHNYLDPFMNWFKKKKKKKKKNAPQGNMAVVAKIWCEDTR